MNTDKHLDLEQITVAYYDWLAGHGGIDPETLLAMTRTPQERRALLEAFDDVTVVWGLTAPLRNAARTDSSSPPLRRAT